MNSPNAFAFHKEHIAMRLLQRVESDPLLPARSDILPFIPADGALRRRIVRRRILRSAGYADVAHNLCLIICRPFSHESVIRATPSELRPRVAAPVAAVVAAPV